jgi:hypothetical protein
VSVSIFDWYYILTELTDILQPSLTPAKAHIELLLLLTSWAQYLRSMLNVVNLQNIGIERNRNRDSLLHLISEQTKVSGLQLHRR